MRPVDLDALMAVAEQLDRLQVPYAFTGGIVIGFLLDNPAVVDIRPTNDVDAITEVVTRIQFTDLEKQLRNLGFSHDTSEGAPICRWLYQGIKVDIMPTTDTTGHLSDRWFAYALQTASLKSLRHVTVRTVSATCFVATKLVAFQGRGHNDFLGSHDIEDIVTVVDGRISLLNELAAEESSLRVFVSGEIRTLLARPQFADQISGHLSSDAASQQRLPLLIERLRAIAKLVPEASPDT